jgi:hypothetical protein
VSGFKNRARHVVTLASVSHSESVCCHGGVSDRGASGRSTSGRSARGRSVNGRSASGRSAGKVTVEVAAEE